MKNLVYIMMCLMGLIVFVSCDKGSEYDESATFKTKPAPTPDPTPTPTDTTKKDTIPTWNGDWGTPVKNNLVAIGEPSANSHLWNGIMVFYGGEDSLVRTTDQTVEFAMTPSTGFSSAKTSEEAKYTGQSTISSNSQNTTYGEWYEDKEGNYLRKVTMTAEVKTSEFNKTLKMTRRDAYCVVDGRENAFKYHTMSATLKSLNVVETKEIERNDSVFEQKTYRLVFICKFAVSAQNLRQYEVFATHTVESFVRLVESEEMPTPDLWVSKIIRVTDLVASPIWAGSDKISSWAKTSLVEDEESFHIWVDGSFVRTIKKSELASGNYNAAMKDGDKWVPCLCQKKDGGFNYAVEYADGSYKVQTVDQRLAVNSGLKNFTANDVAAQTPFIKTVMDKKEYNGKLWMKVTGFNVDGKTTISYTVAER